MNRRSFVKNVSIVGAGLITLPSWACAPVNHNIGLQLYTLRDIIGNNIVDIIAQAAKIGYKEVETFGYHKKSGFFGLKPADFYTLLKDNGLSAPSSHFGVDILFKDGGMSEIEEYIEANAQINSKYLTIPWIEPHYRRNIDDYKKHAASFNKAGELCKKAGMKLAYHNHDFEFKKFENTTGLDILINETDPALVDFELDIYWATRSGYDPLELLKKHKDRFSLWHVKDISKNNRDLNTEIGKGGIDFVTLFKNAKELGLKHAFVEQETNYVPNPMESVKTSFNYIKSII